MRSNKPSRLIVDADTDHVIVECDNLGLSQILIRLGANRVGKTNDWRFRLNGQAELAQLFARLRDEGIPFLAGVAGWPPAALFELYREKGLLTGQYIQAWNGGLKQGWELHER